MVLIPKVAAGTGLKRSRCLTVTITRAKRHMRCLCKEVFPASGRESNPGGLPDAGGRLRLSNHFPLVSTSFGQLASAFLKFAALSWANLRLMS